MPFLSQRDYYLGNLIIKDKIFRGYYLRGHDPVRHDDARRWICLHCGFAITDLMIAGEVDFEMPPKCSDWCGG